MKVVGFKKVDFKAPAKEDMPSQQIKGIKVYCTYSDVDDKNLVGTACEAFFVSENKADGWVPKIGDEIEVVYNKYGKIDKIKLLKTAA